jgi:hypothetical protein
MLDRMTPSPFSVLARPAWCIVLAAGVAGCGSVASALGFTQDRGGSCGPPPPVPAPFLYFAYPGNGATSVPTTIGRLIFGGFPSSSSAIAVNAPSGNGVPAGPLAPAPSPLPTPLATPPPPTSAGGPYFAASVPALAASTTYSVSYAFSEWSNTPPCTQTVTVPLGSFTTQ